MRVAVIGASGHVSKYIVPELLEKGFTVRVMSRSGSHDNSSCEVFHGDALNASDVNNLLDGADAVVNCIGQLKNASGFYTRVTENIISAMNSNRIRRYILITNSTVVLESDVRTFLVAIGGVVFGTLFPKMTVDKSEEVATLMKSDVDWTIFRLPYVMDGKTVKSPGYSYSRMGGFRVFSKQVAAAVVEELSNGTHIRRAPLIFDGAGDGNRTHV